MSRVLETRGVLGLACAMAALAVAAPERARAIDHSILRESTVIGRNTGLPSVGPGVPRTPPGEIDMVFEMAFFFKNLELLGLDEVNGKTEYGVVVPAILGSAMFVLTLAALCGLYPGWSAARIRPAEALHYE